ncbi:ATP binding domain 4 [Perkinsus olseni]|uniref:Diphthine--ammonia ligase n=1 Tax=Perkinsus olseni TaxID=32597 RepID=A0A7J6KXQ1_PEROL|nr:ATP binding domain 4 [Perkinsus olseni]
MLLEQLPHVLCIEVSRHVTETMHTMTQVSVPFPGILNIPPTCLAGGKKHPQAEKTYTLLGVVSRSGLGATSGHYWAFSRPAPPCPTTPPPSASTTTKSCPNQLHTSNEDQSSRTIGRDDEATAPATAAVVDDGDTYPLASSSSSSSSTHWWHFDDETYSPGVLTAVPSFHAPTARLFSSSTIMRRVGDQRRSGSSINVWNATSGGMSSRICTERAERDRHRKHLMALDNIKSSIDNKPPKEVSHLKHKRKTKQLMEEREAQIRRENRILLQKMLSRDNKRMSSKQSSSTHQGSAGRGGSQQRRQEEQHRQEWGTTSIADENRKMLHRLHDVSPVVIDNQKLAQAEREREVLMNRLSSGSGRYRRQIDLEVWKSGGGGNSSSGNKRHYYSTGFDTRSRRSDDGYSRSMEADGSGVPTTTQLIREVERIREEMAGKLHRFMSSFPSAYSLLPTALRSQLGLGLRGLAPKLIGGGVGLAGLGFIGKQRKDDALYDRWPSSYWSANTVFCDTLPACNDGVAKGPAAIAVAPSVVRGEECAVLPEVRPPILHTQPRRLPEEEDGKLSFLRRLLRSVWRLIQLFFRFSPCLVTSPILLLGMNKYNSWWWQWLVRCIENSGPAFIKLGQWAATRRDLFDDTIIRYLSQLHTQVRPHPYRDTLLQLDESYGPEWRTWLEVEPSVIGSGCIAQVHRGRLLYNGDEVAVKVSHPGCQDIIYTDLGILRAVGRLADHMPFLRHLGVSDMVDQFSEFLLSQTDLRLEADNIQRFNDNFNGYSQDIRFPKVYSNITTRTVLIETFEHGIPIGALLPSTADHGPAKEVDDDGDKVMVDDDDVMVSKRDICQMGVKAFLHMLFIDNLIHGDLHPGNILVQADKSGASSSGNNDTAGVRLVFLDCGLANELSDRDLTNFVDLMHAIMIGESSEVGRLMIERSRSPPSTVYKPDQFIRGVEDLVDSARGVSLQGMQLGIVFSQLLALACKHSVRLEPNFVSVVCATMVLEGLGRSLDPQLHILKEAKPFVARALFNRLIGTNSNSNKNDTTTTEDGENSSDSFYGLRFLIMKVVGLVSGGKDSLFNLHLCKYLGHDIVCVANLHPPPPQRVDDGVKGEEVDEGMKEEMDSYMYAHTVGHEVVPVVAEALGLPLYKQAINRAPIETNQLVYDHSTNKGRDHHMQDKDDDDEVEDLYGLLVTVKEAHPEVNAVSCGAIFSDYQRLRVENVCQRLGLMVLAFMWRLPQDRLLDWMINTGIEARLVKVACMGLDERHLSQTLSQLRPYFTKLHNQFGFHVCGEGGEYETLTTDCPLYLNGRIDLGDTRVVKHSADVYYLQSANPHLEPKEATTNNWNDACTSLSILDSLEYYEQDYPRLESVHNKYIMGTLAPSTEYEILYVEVQVSDMSSFAAVNEEYCNHFPTVNPPTRYCIQTDLPQGVLVRFRIIAMPSTEAAAAAAAVVSTLHVQSISTWAMSCIGPYSQAKRFDNGTLLTAGVLGLVPHTMSLPSPGGWQYELWLAMRSLHEITDLMSSENTVLATLFIAGRTPLIPAIQLAAEYLDVDPSRIIGLRLPALPRGASVEVSLVNTQEDSAAADAGHVSVSMYSGESVQYLLDEIPSGDDACCCPSVVYYDVTRYEESEVYEQLPSKIRDYAAMTPVREASIGTARHSLLMLRSSIRYC